MSPWFASVTPILLLALVADHARKRAAGKVPEKTIWKDTYQMALIMFVLLIIVVAIDYYLHWRTQ